MFSKLFDKTLKGAMFIKEYEERIAKDEPGKRYVIDDTICELHRQIYDNLILSFHDRPRELKKIIPILESAFRAGLKMTKKLVEYKCSLPDWDVNLSAIQVIRMRKLRVQLTRILEAIEKQ